MIQSCEHGLPGDSQDNEYLYALIAVGSYTTKMFWDQMRVNEQTFFFLCKTLGPNIKM